MEQVDEADTGQAQVGQGAAAYQLIADQAEILELVEGPALVPGAEAPAHGRAEIEIAVIDGAGGGRKKAVVRLAVGLNQLVHLVSSYGSRLALGNRRILAPAHPAPQSPAAPIRGTKAASGARPAAGRLKT